MGVPYPYSAERVSVGFGGAARCCCLVVRACVRRMPSEYDCCVPSGPQLCVGVLLVVMVFLKLATPRYVAVRVGACCVVSV